MSNHPSFNKDDIVKREIRFAIHLPKNEKREYDAHYIKEQVTLKDGQQIPLTHLVKDYKRPIWVTKKAFRNHKEKKEFEDLDKLHELQCTQSDLNRVVANLLDSPQLVNNPKELKNSPYLYGYDQTSTSLIKLHSLKRNEFIQSPYTVASLDIETNPKTQDILIISLAFKNKIYLAYTKAYLDKDYSVRIKEAFNYYLPQYKDHELHVFVGKNEVEIIEYIFRAANELKPDFLSIWNMDFDIPKILNALKKYNVNPIDVLCDPNLPSQYRYCRYKQGIKKKVTASGVVKPINPSLQWHTLFLTAPFYVIDSMCVYRQLRMASQEKPSYKLDYILQEELGSRKLSFDVADQYKGVNWHLFLQEKYPIEYLIYNLYDTLSLLELDEKTKDLQSTLPSFAGMTDFNRFNSNPKKIVDALFVFGLEKNKVIGTVGYVSEEKEIPDEYTENEEDEDDPNNYETLDLKGWIQLLPQNQLIVDGLALLKEFPHLKTNARGMVVDLDSVSSYPTCTLVANVSKETCYTELIDIKGVKEEQFRLQNLGLVLGESNLLEYFHVMFGMPQLDELDEFLKDIL